MPTTEYLTALLARSFRYMTQLDSKYITEDNSRKEYHFMTRKSLPSLSGPLAPEGKINAVSVVFGND